MLGLCYSDVAVDGLYATFDGSPAGGLVGLSFAGPMPKNVTTIHAGRNTVELVNTTSTVSEVPDTVDWFPELLDENMLRSSHAVMHGCGNANATHHAQLRVRSKWTHRRVSKKSMIGVIGELGGAWSAALAVCAVALRGLDPFVRKPSVERIPELAAELTAELTAEG